MADTRKMVSGRTANPDGRAKRGLGELCVPREWIVVVDNAVSLLQARWAARRGAR